MHPHLNFVIEICAQIRYNITVKSNQKGFYMINILYDDEYIAVAVKPAGVISESGGFPDLLRDELSQTRGEKINLYTVHRLDKETEGIMVYALSQEAAADLSRDITNGLWQKTYSARVCGIPQKESDTLRDLLYYDRARSKSFVVKRERKGVKEAILHYSVERVCDGYSTLKIHLETGRTHQIRVQFASRGLPLCGDRRYGAPASSGKSLALCACGLKLRHPKTMEELEFKIEANF